MSSEKGQKHAYAQEHQLYYHYNNCRGHLEKKSMPSEIIIIMGIGELFGQPDR